MITEGDDFLALSSLELTFTAGQAVGSKECIIVEVLDDLIVEEDFETFTISVTPSGVDADVLQLENSTSQVSIKEDNDSMFLYCCSFNVFIALCKIFSSCDCWVTA